jgi:hypothetical protein
MTQLGGHRIGMTQNGPAFVTVQATGDDAKLCDLMRVARVTQMTQMTEPPAREGRSQMDHDNRRQSLSPTALTVANAARLLTEAGGHLITVEMLEADLAVGAPANADGTINLVHYAAWLVREMGSRD